METKESETHDQVKFVAVPVGVMNELISLISTEISWGRANPIMAKLEASYKPIDIKEK